MAFLDPQAVLENFGIQEGSTVADLGAGSGFYTMAAARMVGTGRVYAVDVQQDLLTRLQNTARAAKITNISVLHGDMERPGGTRLQDGSVDSAIISNVLFQVEQKESFVKEVKRILKSGGKALVIDWSDSFNSMGPEEKLVVTESAARSLFEKAGFEFVNSIDAGDNHYGLVYRKP
jgi:ubiquinone/menaquinone biosynthesis C-methylase UbiE